MHLIQSLQQVVTQAEFAQVIGVSEAKVSQLVSDGVLVKGQPAGLWLLAYVERLREQAAGRMGDGGGLDLVQERAALARAQRLAQELKNAVARGEYAPIGLLSDVLATASAGVVDRMEQLEGALAKACPDLPEEARLVVQQVMASARNEWVRCTASLIDSALADPDDSEDEELAVIDVDALGEDAP